MQWRRRIGLIVLFVVIAAAIGYGFRPQPRLVEVAETARAPLRVTVEEEGQTRVIDRYVISAPVAGYAHRVQLDVGDAVTQGQTLLELEPLPSNVLDPRSRAQARARVAAADASLRAAQETAAAAKAEADYAQAEFKRLSNLRKAKSVSEQDVEGAEARSRQAQARLRSARFAVDVARHELEAAETALQYSAAQGGGANPETVLIRSPVNGRVLNIRRKSEGVVDAGDALVQVGNPRALEVEVDVLSADAVRIAPGTRVMFERWGGGRPLEGVVRVVEPVGFTKVSALGVEEQRVWVIADFASPPEEWERLGDGYRVEASFIVWENDNVLQIPASALFRYGDGWAVFAVEEGKATRREVQIGHRNDLRAEIIAGLQEDDRVITHPDDTIEDGDDVQVR